MFNLRGLNKGGRKKTKKPKGTKPKGTKPKGTKQKGRKSSKKSTKSNPIKKEKMKLKTQTKTKKQTKGKAGEPPLRKYSIVKLYKKKERTPETKWREGVITSVNNATNIYEVLHNKGIVRTNVHRDNLVLIKEQPSLDIIKIKIADDNVIKKFKKAGLYKPDPTNKVGRARFFALANKEDDMTESIQRIVFPGRFHGPN